MFVASQRRAIIFWYFISFRGVGNETYWVCGRRIYADKKHTINGCWNLWSLGTMRSFWYFSGNTCERQIYIQRPDAAQHHQHTRSKNSSNICLWNTQNGNSELLFGGFTKGNSILMIEIVDCCMYECIYQTIFHKFPFFSFQFDSWNFTKELHEIPHRATTIRQDANLFKNVFETTLLYISDGMVPLDLYWRWCWRRFIKNSIQQSACGNTRLGFLEATRQENNGKCDELLLFYVVRKGFGEPVTKIECKHNNQLDFVAGIFLKLCWKGIRPSNGSILPYDAY